MNGETANELTRLNAAVDAFALEMKRALARKAQEGYAGWDNPANAPEVQDRFLEHVFRDDPNYVHVASLAMMLHRLGAAEDG